MLRTLVRVCKDYDTTRTAVAPRTQIAVCYRNKTGAPGKSPCIFFKQERYGAIATLNYSATLYSCLVLRCSRALFAADDVGMHR